MSAMRWHCSVSRTVAEYEMTYSKNRTGRFVRFARTRFTHRSGKPMSFHSQYTRASKDDPNVERNTENECWNEAGIIRFNELRQLVQKDCTENPDFKINWLRQARAAMKKTDGLNVGEDAGSKHVEADDDFQQGAASNPGLNEALNQEGVANEETDKEEGEEGEETDTELA
jgi:hypothetical protein